MGKPIKDILRPIAFALIAVYYERQQRTADSQTNAMWTADHWDGVGVPLGYVAELRLTLKYTGNGVKPPKRRAGDKVEEQLAERSTHA